MNTRKGKVFGMNRRHWVLAIAALALLIPNAAEAGRGYSRSRGPAMTAYGPIYNPALSQQYRAYIQNPAGYERMMMAKQQQALFKQQQAMFQQYQKWAKTPEGKKYLEQQQQAQQQAIERQRAREQARKEAKEQAERKHKELLKKLEEKRKAKVAAPDSSTPKSPEK